MKLYNIQTTAYEEENLKIISDLSCDDITDIINPIVLNERENNFYYDNDLLILELRKAYPDNVILKANEETLIY